jgi:hypothetical protein
MIFLPSCGTDILVVTIRGYIRSHTPIYPKSYHFWQRILSLVHIFTPKHSYTAASLKEDEFGQLTSLSKFQILIEIWHPKVGKIR